MDETNLGLTVLNCVSLMTMNSQPGSPPSCAIAAVRVQLKVSLWLGSTVTLTGLVTNTSTPVERKRREEEGGGGVMYVAHKQL